MGRIETTKLAYKRSVLATNPTIARRCSNLRHSISHWSFPLVREPDSPRAPPAPRHWEALAEPVGMSAMGVNGPTPG
jgi:hypothetical protein